jgi:hypothetical protein
MFAGMHVRERDYIEVPGESLADDIDLPGRILPELRVIIPAARG